MSTAKLVVIYPIPTDLGQFERLYLEQHVPMAVDESQSTKFSKTLLTPFRRSSSCSIGARYRNVASDPGLCPISLRTVEISYFRSIIVP